MLVRALRLKSGKEKWKALASIMSSMKNDAKLGVVQTYRRNQTKQASGRDMKDNMILVYGKVKYGNGW